MNELPDSIKAILKAEGVSVLCWKRMRDAWAALPASPNVDACQRILDEANRLLADLSGSRILEIRTLPESCETLKEAEKAVIVSAVSRAGSYQEVCRRTGMGKSTLFRKLREFGLSSPSRMRMALDAGAKIAAFEAEIARLRKLLPLDHTTQQAEPGGK